MDATGQHMDGRAAHVLQKSWPWIGIFYRVMQMSNATAHRLMYADVLQRCCRTSYRQHISISPCTLCSCSSLRLCACFSYLTAAAACQARSEESDIMCEALNLPRPQGRWTCLSVP
jgi:hypothetical protein